MTTVGGLVTTTVLVGLDMGTTRIKAVAVDLSGRIVAETAEPTPWRHRGAEADCDPRELAAAARRVVLALPDDARWPADARAAGIGVTGMAETGVLLDAQGDPLAPALAWHDPRGRADVVDEAVGASAFMRHVGMRLNSKPSVAKILWLQQEIPQARAAVRHLCVGEWIVHAFGGEQVGELSLSSRTGLLDVLARRPWDATADLVGPLLPERLVVAGEACGRADLPEPFRGATLTVAGMDHQSAAFACSAAVAGTLFDSLGTAEALLRFVPASLDHGQLELLSEDDIAVLWSVVPDHLCVLGATLAGLSLERVLALLGVREYAARAELAQAALRTTRHDSTLGIAQATHLGVEVAGIDDGASPALMWRVAVEDLFELSDRVLARMEEIVGPRDRTVIAGGWINDAMVRDVKERTLGPLRVSEVAEAGAVGAALLSGIAAGVIARPAAHEGPRWPDGG